ncbi:hypothetical protein FA95DRAFT_1567767 [Auriscalpium vulgare]|uniref:Uncharacterized protein n=1 Tax=Auriscalpium vulgare TaxID=40419 RepID=A0ACB8R2R6_9AGAM|nr:hypothetical protein FA95DRAFT_1567767 [Auriscalpium vulgare]
MSGKQLRNIKIDTLLSTTEAQAVLSSTSYESGLLQLMEIHGLRPEHLASVISRFERTHRNTPKLTDAHAAFQKNRAAHAAELNMAYHHEKRALVKGLGFLRVSSTPRRHLDEFIRNLVPGVEVVIVENKPSPVAKRVCLEEFPRPGETVDYELASSANGYYVLDANRSAIFLSKDPDNGYIFELLIIRNIGSDTPGSMQVVDSFYRWLTGVIEQACDVRRDVRPNHAGKMTQLGFNAGPRHARVWGPGVSFAKQLDAATKTAQDQEAVAAFSIFWAIAEALAPCELIDPINSTLEDIGMPRLATRQVSEGTGWRATLEDGKTYEFPCAQRAPPEGYMALDYSAPVHTDKLYTKTAFALTAAVSEYPAAPHIPSAGLPSQPSRRTTRAHKHSHINPIAAVPLPPHGGSFVDLDIKVVSRPAARTLMAFKPTHKHGTTSLHCRSTQVMSITFSQHIRDAYEKAKGAGIGSQWQHGNGHSDEID